MRSLFDSDTRREKRIEQIVEKGFKIIADNWAAMKAIPDPTDNPLASEVRANHLPLEMEGKRILTDLAKTKRMTRDDRHNELKQLEIDADSFRRDAQIWAKTVAGTVRAEGVGYPRPTRQVDVGLVVTIPPQTPSSSTPSQFDANPEVIAPESPAQGTNLRKSLSSLDSNSFGPLTLPNPIDALPMELIYAIDRYTTPSSSPTHPNYAPRGSEDNSEHPSESTASRELDESTTVSSVTTMSESDIQLALTDVANLRMHDLAFTETTAKCNKVAQKESLLCPAIAA